MTSLLDRAVSRALNKNDFEKCIKIIKMLIKHKAPVDPDILCRASSFDNTKIAEIFLGYGANINATDYFEKTPLHYAVERENEEVVKFFLERGASVNPKDKKGKSPLHYASTVSIATLLLEKGATIDALDEYKRFPLYAALAHLQGATPKWWSFLLKEELIVLLFLDFLPLLRSYLKLL